MVIALGKNISIFVFLMSECAVVVVIGKRYMYKDIFFYAHTGRSESMLNFL